MASIPKPSEKKTYLISGKTLGFLVSAANQWFNLEVKFGGPNDTKPSLTKADQKSILLIPQYSSTSGGGSQSSHPFKIQPVDEGIVTITPGDVTDGFIGGIIPKIDGVFINTVPMPELSVDSGAIFLNCTMTSAGKFTQVDIETGGTLPEDTETNRYRLIGTVEVTDGNVIVTLQSVTTSVSHKLCGNLSTWGQA